MSAETDRHQDYITAVRQDVRKIFDGILSLKSKQTQWNEGGYGDNLTAGDGENTGITKDDIGPVVFAVADALQAILDGGNGGNIEKML